MNDMGPMPELHMTDHKKAKKADEGSCPTRM